MLTTLLAALITLAPAAQQAATHGQLHFTPSTEWRSRAVTSMMRVAEFDLPAAPGDAEAAALIVYYFGGTGGTVQANIDRWFTQFSQPNGRPTKEVAKVSSRRINTLSVTDLDVTGTYVAEVTPGSAERHNKPGFRMRAAVVETPRGPYFIRVVGPAATVARWESAVETFFQSMVYR